MRRSRRQVAAVFASPGDPVIRSIVAVDPDGDAVRFTLLEGPDGMTVGRADGRLAWVADRPGSQVVRIGIEDAFGLHGDDVSLPLEVGDRDQAFTASPLAASGSGGGGSFGWSGLAVAGLALASWGRGRRHRRPRV